MTTSVSLDGVYHAGFVLGKHLLRGKKNFQKAYGDIFKGEKMWAMCNPSWSYFVFVGNFAQVFASKGTPVC